MLTIVGAGPVGSYLGYLLSKNGIDNTILEEHKEIGRPEQCTGLISRNIESLIRPSRFKKAVLNKVNGAVIRCSNRSFDIKADDFKAYVFDRVLFDQAIAKQAERQGSKILLGHRYTNHKISEKGIDISIKNGTEHKQLRSSILIGADGPSSIVSKNSGIHAGRKFWIGNQVILKSKEPCFEKDKVQIYLDKKYSDNFFAWIVPIDEEKAKVGLACSSKPAEYMKRFLKDQFKDYTIEENHAGLIPIYRNLPVQNKQKNIFLVGDSASQAKPISGGGVVKGMMSAQALCDSIVAGDRDYEKRLGKIRRNLWIHSVIRNKMNKMSDKRTSDLLSLLNSDKIKNILVSKGDMDFPNKFLPRLFLAEPRLLKFIY